MQNLSNMQCFCKYIYAHCFDCSTYVISIIVSNVNIAISNNFEHCHAYTTGFLSSKVKFIHTSTVTRSHSCYGKKLRVRLPYILLIFITHYCYYLSIGVLHIKWYATQVMYFLRNISNSMCSLPTCNHIIMKSDIISPCTLVYL